MCASCALGEEVGFAVETTTPFAALGGPEDCCA